jgi:O-antigen/teichoic acid export membrane protein
VPLAVLFVGSVFPIMSNYFAEGNIERFKSLYQRCHDLITLGGMAMVTGVVLFAEPMVQLLGGDEYHQAVTVLRVLAMAVPPIWLGVLADYGLVATGRQNVLLWLAGLSMLTNLAANLILIPIYGKEGAAASTVIGEFAMLMPALFLLGRAMGETPSFWVAGRLLPVSGVVALLAYALPLWWVPEALIVGTLFGVGVAAMRVISVDDLKLLLRRAEPEIMPVEVGAGN